METEKIKASFYDTDYKINGRNYEVFVHCPSCSSLFVASTLLPMDFTPLLKRDHILFTATDNKLIDVCACEKPKIGRMLFYRVTGKTPQHLNKEFTLDPSDNYINSRGELAGGLKLTSEFTNFVNVKSVRRVR